MVTCVRLFCSFFTLLCCVLFFLWVYVCCLLCLFCCCLFLCWFLGLLSISRSSSAHSSMTARPFATRSSSTLHESANTRKATLSVYARKCSSRSRASILLARSSMKSTKSISARIVPCGMPAFITHVSENSPSTRTLTILLCRKARSTLQSQPRTPRLPRQPAPQWRPPSSWPRSACASTCSFTLRGLHTAAAPASCTSGGSATTGPCSLHSRPGASVHLCVCVCVCVQCLPVP